MHDAVHGERELPEIYRKQPIYYITNRFSGRGTNTTVKWPLDCLRRRTNMPH